MPSNVLASPPQRIVISGATESAAFSLTGLRAYIKFSTAATATTATLQDLDIGGSTYTDTPLTLTLSASDETRWTTEDLAPYCGAASQESMFKISLNASDTVTFVVWSN